MYIPKHFEMTDQDEVFGFIEQHAFGQLTSQVSGRLFSTHLPFLVSEDRQSLLCHVAKQNPQWEEIDGQEAMVTLEGPHGYISPSWYEGAGVPTWNYQAVHAYGQCKTFVDADRLKGLVDALTQKYEAGFEIPWVPEYGANMLNAIVGIEIEINEIQCKYKLGQNRPMVDRRNLVEKLEEQGCSQLAGATAKIGLPKE